MENKTISYASIADVPISEWKKLAQQNIYFGHKSVGYNIVEGIEMILAENEAIKLKIIKAQEMDAVQKGIFLHSHIGRNRYPQSKMDAFNENLKRNKDKGLDIAFMKLCYIDVNPKTKADNFFDAYKRSMNAIKMNYPKLKLIYMTVPLKTIKPIGFKNNVKEIIKSVLGKSTVEQEKRSNYNRYKINNMIRAEYGRTGLLFDIAKLESTKKNGGRNAYDYQGEKVEALNADYSSDGGHLNEKGKKYIAEKLLVFLAQHSID